MIVSASYKTDIPAFYGAWFLNRLRAGYCKMVNPYGGQVSTVRLDGDSVDGFVFWTRNLEPFLGALEEVGKRDLAFIVHLTATGYPRALDYATIAPKRAAEQGRLIAATYGARVAVWRYDPIVITSLTPPEWHLDNFRRLAGRLTGAVDEVVVSFAQIYRKTGRNMAAASRAFDFSWSDPEIAEKQDLLAALNEIAGGHGMKLTLCGQPKLLIPGVAESSCIDVGRLSDAAGRHISAPGKPHRDCCRCFASKDIGAYDTCPHGCVYCYGVNSRTTAKRRYAGHDPQSEFLFEPALKVAPAPKDTLQGRLF